MANYFKQKQSASGLASYWVARKELADEDLAVGEQVVDWLDAEGNSYGTVIDVGPFVSLHVHGEATGQDATYKVQHRNTPADAWADLVETSITAGAPDAVYSNNIRAGQFRVLARYTGVDGGTGAVSFCLK